MSACPDPAKKFDDFVERTEEARNAEPVDQGEGALEDISGEFLLGLAANLGVTLEFIATAEMTVADDKKSGTLNLTIQPLKLFDGADRTPVGAALSVSDIAVGEDGSFEARFGSREAVVSVDGQANPLTGNPIEADIVLAGLIKGADAFCGTVTGTLDAPIPGHDLSGSNFAAIRITAGTIGGDLPAVKGKCADLDPGPAEGEGEGEDGPPDPFGEGEGEAECEPLSLESRTACIGGVPPEAGGGEGGGGEGEGEGEGELPPAGGEGEGEGGGDPAGEGEGEGEGPGDLCACEPLPPVEPAGDITVEGIVRDYKSLAPAGGEEDRLLLNLRRPIAPPLSAEEKEFGYYAPCETGRFEFADTSSDKPPVGIVTDDLDCGADVWLTSFNGTYGPGATMESIRTTAYAIRQADIDAWNVALREKLDNAEFDIRTNQESGTGCLIGRIRNKRGDIVVGATITKNGALPANAHFFNADMTGFTDGEVTTESGAYLIAGAGLGSYVASIADGSLTWGPALARGGSEGVCVIGELFAQ